MKVFTQSEIKISWPAGLQKPEHVNASALVGITICRVKAKKFAWSNTPYKWTVSCNVFVASSRHLHIVQSGPLYSALVWEVDVSSRHIQFPGVIRRGPNGVSCNFATKNQNRLRDKMQGKLSCVIRPLPTVLFCSLLNNDEMTREVWGGSISTCLVMKNICFHWCDWFL